MDGDDPYVLHNNMHEAFHKQLDNLIIDYYDSSSKNLADAPEKFVRFKSYLYLHMAWEEEKLYSAVDANSKMHTVTVGLRAQHERLKELVKCVEMELEARGTKVINNVEYETELEELVEAHGIMEEELFFPLLEKHIGKEELSKALVDFPK